MRKLKIFLFVMPILIIGIFGCYNQKKAVGSVNKAIEKYPDTTRSIFQKRWPVIIRESKPDSTEWFKFMAAIDSLQQLNDYLYQRKPDTVPNPYPIFDSAVCREAFDKNASLARDYNALLSEYKKLQDLCKGKPAIHDTFSYEDSSKIDMWISLYKKEVFDRLATARKLEKSQDKVKSKNTQLLVFYILTGLGLIFLGFKISKKFYNPAKR